MVDPLEERQLLSLTAGHIDDMQVNQSLSVPVLHSVKEITQI